VVTSAAELADETGRLGVEAPALYKHVAGIDDLRRRVVIKAGRSSSEAFAYAPGVMPTCLMKCRFI